MDSNQNQTPRRFSFTPSPLGIIPREHLSPDRASRRSTQLTSAIIPGATSTPRNSIQSMSSSLVPQIGTSIANRLPAGTNLRRSSTANRTFSTHTHSEEEIIRNMSSLPETAQRFILTGESMGIDTNALQLPSETQRSFPQCDRTSAGGQAMRDSTFENKPSCCLAPVPSSAAPACSTQCCPKPKETRSRTIERNNSMESISMRPLSPIASVNPEISLPPPINFMDELQTRMFPAPTEFYRKKLEKYQHEVAMGGGDAHRINSELNEMFIRRLTEIDCQGTKDCDIRLITYQEWVEMLLKLNDIVINNMRDLEAEVVERMDLLKCGLANNSLQDETESVSKYRNDVCMLVKLVQNAYFDDNWSMEGMTFQTITPSDILGSSDGRSPRSENGRRQSQTPSDSSSRVRVSQEQLVANTKALAIEVAHKHDMICDLKKQITCLEDEIQNAQKKIQLKDDVIRGLRNDLKCANSKQVKILTDASVDCNMPPINSESKFQESMVCITGQDPQNPNISHRFVTAEENIMQSTRSSNTDETVTEHTARSITTNDLDCSGSSFLCEDVSQCDEIQEIERTECDNLAALCDELDNFDGVANNNSKAEDLVNHGQRLSAIVKRAEAEKTLAYRKLNFIRELLVDLEAKAGDPFESDCDSGFSSKCDEKDQDSRIIVSLRRRLSKLNTGSFSLKKRVQELEIEKRELESKLNTEACFAQRNCEILKEIADLLSTITGEPFKYNDVYIANTTKNPFCDAITKIKVDYKTQEDRFVEDVMNMHKKVEELEQAICHNKEDQVNNKTFSTPITTTSGITPNSETEQQLPSTSKYTV